ncbi:MAG: HAD-IIIA family hydrolase [Patescibacteria group bacterium]|nr:HAD-IIIA family hydrolase [Patescibacteria group bacterium]
MYICPHTPDDHCTCRKPGTGLLEKAIEDFDLDISQCYFVGDKESDIQAGISAGCKTVWIENNLHPCTVKSDFIVTSLKQFSEILSSLPIN